jgi:ligand-binding sensor domain-containing protein
MQGYPIIAGARAPDRTEVWLGTAGGGLVQVDPNFNSGTPRPYGLASSGAGAIARAADGIWIAPASRGMESRVALTFASRDLQRWRWLDDAARRGFSGARATALAVRDGTLWMGTTRGLYRVEIDGAAVRTFTPLSGLPGDVVLTVLALNDGLWVGTDRGLAFLPNRIDTRDRLISPLGDAGSLPINALLATGDTLWIGSNDGLFVVRRAGESPLVRPASSPFSVRLRASVRALAQSDSLVFVAQRDAILAFNLKTGAWSDPWPAAAWRSAGEIQTIAADAHTVWAGGGFGVVAVDRATGGSRILRAGSDLPDVVTGIVLDGAYAWIATLGGVVRVRRTADGQIP